MDERRLEDVAKGLGADAAEAVDAEALAERVLTRLRVERARGWRRLRTAWRVAAAIVVLAGAGLAIGRLVPGDGAVARYPTPVELEDLGSAELADILDSLAADVPVAELVPLAVADLNEAELELLLQSMEG